MLQDDKGIAFRVEEGTGLSSFLYDVPGHNKKAFVLQKPNHAGERYIWIQLQESSTDVKHSLNKQTQELITQRGLRK